MPNSVEKTMLLLRAVSDGRGQPVSLESLSHTTGINKSTAAHIISCLCKNGYLHRVSHNLGYVTGPGLHYLTRYGRYGEDIIGECHPILEYIGRESGGTAVFAVLREGRKYIIDRVSESNIYSDSEASILEDDLYRTVTGRVLLANAPADEALKIYDSCPPNGTSWSRAVNRKGFLSELSEIRRTDCCYLDSQSGEFNWHSFALPVFRNKSCVGAMGLALRFEKSRKLSKSKNIRISEMMIQCRKELERRLGFTI